MKPLSVFLGMLLAGTVAGTAIAQDATAPPRTARDANTEWSDDGLEKVPLPGVDVAYIRPEAGVGKYHRYLIAPVEVAFRRGWDRSAAPRPNQRVRQEDQQEIRDRVARLVREELEKELTAGGYVMADAPADDVLLVQVRIVDLYVVAPQQVNAPDRVYAYGAGEMTLVAELADSGSGEVEARLFDKTKAPETSTMHLVFHSENEREARKIVEDWAKSLRILFDAARVAAAN